MKGKTKSILNISFKVFFLLVALAVFVYGGFLIVCAIKSHNVVKEMKKPLAEVTVDFSKNNGCDLLLPPVREYFHGLGLWIEIKTNEKQEKAIEQFVNGLSGSVTVFADKDFMCKFDFSDEDFYCYPAHSSLRDSENFAYIMFIESIPEYAAESSQIKITIDQPAGGLQLIEQKLLVKYKLCGCESMGVIFAYVFGAIAILIGLGIGIPLSMSLISRKPKFLLKKQETSEASD